MKRGTVRGRGCPAVWRAWIAALALLWAAGPGVAQDTDFLVTDGKLSTVDFYRLVSCRAMPGGPCESEVVRWSEGTARGLRVGIAPVPQDYPPRLAALMDAALDTVIAEINGVGAALELVRVDKKGQPQVEIFLTGATEGERIRGTGIEGVDGEVIGAGLVTVWWDRSNRISRAAIVMAADLPQDEVLPVLLEEVTQSLGLLTDIRNPWYNGRSVFSEDSNSVASLAPQDRLALRMHYPPEGGQGQE